MIFAFRYQNARTWKYLLLAACTGILLACGDDHDDGADAGHDEDGHGEPGHHDGVSGDIPGCGKADNCTGEELTPGVDDAIDGQDGIFSATISEAGDYTDGEGTQVAAQWTLVIEDADGSTVTDAKVMVQTWSNDCMHDGPSAPVEVTADADGNYVIPSTFAHGGPWETRLMISAGGAMDEIRIPVCVPGDEHGGSHGQ